MDKVVRAAKLPVTDEAAAPKAAPRFTKKPAESKSITLEYPIEYDGVEYETVALKSLKGKDFAALTKLGESDNPVSAMIHLMSGIPFEVIEFMDINDLAVLMEEVENFIPRKLVEKAQQLSKSGQNTPE